MHTHWTAHEASHIVRGELCSPLYLTRHGTLDCNYSTEAGMEEQNEEALTPHLASVMPIPRASVLPEAAFRRAPKPLHA